MSVRSSTHFGRPTSLGNVSPPPTIDHPPDVSMGWSKVTRISRVLAASTSLSPSSGTALTTFGGAPAANVEAINSTTAAGTQVRSFIVGPPAAAEMYGDGPAVTGTFGVRRSRRGRRAALSRDDHVLRGLRIRIRPA